MKSILLSNLYINVGRVKTDYRRYVILIKLFSIRCPVLFTLHRRNQRREYVTMTFSTYAKQHIVRKILLRDMDC